LHAGSGWRCQKHPCTKAMIRREGKARSGFPGSLLSWSRYLRLAGGLTPDIRTDGARTAFARNATAETSLSAAHRDRLIASGGGSRRHAEEDRARVEGQPGRSDRLMTIATTWLDRWHLSVDERHDVVNRLRTGDVRVLTSCEIISGGFAMRPRLVAQSCCVRLRKFRAVPPTGRPMPTTEA